MIGMSKNKWVMVLLSSLLITAISIPGLSSEGEVRLIEDGLGRTVRVPAEVERIVGVEAGTLRIITYMGATDRVVGVENFEKRDRKRPYRLAHPELVERANIGPIHGGDAELILASRPDIVFWSYTTRKKANDLQNRTGIPVFVLNQGPPRTMEGEELESSLRLMGEVLGKEERAQEVIGFINGEIDELEKLGKAAEATGLKAYVGGIGQRGAHGISSTEPAYSPFNFIGLKNAAGSIGMDHAMVNDEKIIQWDPDYLFVDEAGLSLVREDLRAPEFQSLSAVRAGRIFGLLPYNYYTTNFGTVLADAYYIGKIVYPEAFAEIDPKKKADDIYEFLVGEPVYSEMAEIFGGFGKIEFDD